MITSKNLNNKSVFIFENHSTAIIPWAELSNSQKVIPYLITLDYHTDTRQAFLRSAYWQANEDENIASILRNEFVQHINKNNRQSVIDAAQMLNHDEHIDAAIKANIISHSFSIQYSDSFGTSSIEEESYINNNSVARLNEEFIELPEPPFSYNVPKDRMFIAPNICAIGCPRGPHTDDCVIEHANQAIEDIFLEDKLNYLNRMSITSGLGCPNERPYILDIDLDYFRTFKSATPNNTSIFYQLIKNSIGITIAKESDCVEMLKLDPELNSAYLEEVILNHIDMATQ